MTCIYLDENNIFRAQPSEVGAEFKPDETYLKKVCKHETEFEACRRLFTYLDYLKAKK